MGKKSMGIDIGGSHITCQIFDLEKNLVIPECRTRMHIDSNKASGHILDGWAKAILQTAGDTDMLTLEGIGFAMPGPFDYARGIAWFKGIPKFEKLYGIDVKTELIRRLQLPVSYKIRFLNDAVCFAMGEAWLGNASKYDRVIALTLGTGFGTTFLKRGMPLAGADGIPKDGFLYHVPFQNSIADDYFSTRWFIENYQKATGETIPGVKELAQRVSSDKHAQKLFMEFGDNLGSFLLPWVKQFDAEAIIIGGNISRSYKWFENSLRTRLGKIPVLISRMEENAALAGSARLCDDIFYNELLRTHIIR